ncbi:hypothetical protein GCM10011505_31130 [Tistrella bauzanensis]|uniref:Uncharacterized protein n=1 Tax=Tistrella bauzanensis TaxID=657419 RepID=A0ABQ1IQR1_9PROT|nr:hypothetical protein [Tistrella bauzanensis]GGB47806.1 hypothetical protein GCM10011505_31130 [Tistrella bauzanensis]
MPSPRRYSEARLTRYVDHGLHGVQGWLDDFSAAAIAKLGDSQSDHGVTGAVAEVGVHHGKLFLGDVPPDVEKGSADVAG